MDNPYLPILVECQQFLDNSLGMPLLMTLPNRYGGFKRVKVRHRKHRNNETAQAFNRAFNKRIFQRAVFCDSVTSFTPVLDERVNTTDIYYIFPPDGYRFLYNPAIKQLDVDHTNDDELEQHLLSDVFAFGYRQDSLWTAIESNTQIILYDIPFYYCVKASTIQYADLLPLLKPYKKDNK